MIEEIATDADKEAVLARLAGLSRVEAGSAEEEEMMSLVSAVAGYVASRDGRQGAES